MALRERPPLLSGVLAAIFALTACGGAAAPVSSPSSTGLASAPATPSGASPATSASSAKSGTVSPSASAAGTAGSIKIGVLEPLTGPLADVGKGNQDGFNLYLSTISGTVAGRKIEALYADTKGTPDVALTKAKQLVESDRVHILAGITATPVCYAVAGYVKQAQVPLAVTGNCGAQQVTTDPKFKSAYLTRFSQSTTLVNDPAADWAYTQGYRKVSMIVSDFGGGLEVADAFGSAFIKRGGTITQEQYPAQGTTDYGPFLAKLDQSADAILAFLPGTDGLRFMQQYSTYASERKPQIIDAYGAITDGPNLEQLKEKTLGVVGVFVYTTALQNPENQAFLKAYREKFPDRIPTKDAAQGYSGAQVLAAAIKKMNGNVEDKRQFLQALYATRVETPKGIVTLDENHDLVQNIYVYQIVKQGASFGQKVLQTYENISGTWDRTPEELARFPIGKLKGKWAGTTRDQLPKLLDS